MSDVDQDVWIKHFLTRFKSCLFCSDVKNLQNKFCMYFYFVFWSDVLELQTVSEVKNLRWISTSCIFTLSGLQMEYFIKKPNTEMCFYF